MGIAPQAPPKVSVVTVVYNGAATIERTILSVLGQGGPDVEYIIVDGGSTDGTLDIVRKYENSLAYWVSEKDQGIYDAMNKGIALCTGEWVGLINADDAYAPMGVQKALEAVEGKGGVNIVHGDILLVYPNGSGKVKHAKRSYFLLKYWEMVLNHPSFFVRREYYRDHPYKPEFRVSGDHHWTLRAWREDPAQFLYLPEVIAHFSAGGASMSGSLKRSLEEGDRINKDLGFSCPERWLGKAVRTVLYMPAMAKLWFNQLVAPLRVK